MCPWTVFDWLRTNEQSVAIWLEGIALVAIFVLELKEYRRQGRERIEQQKESAAQMAIMQSQADAAKANAEAAKLGAKAVLNSERAWVEIILGSPTQPDYEDDPRSTSSGLFECAIQIENKGKTIAHVESVTVGADTTVVLPTKAALVIHFRSVSRLTEKPSSARCSAASVGPKSA